VTGGPVMTTVRQESWDVDRRLRELGLSRAGLISAIRAAAAAVGGCTSDSPPTAFGYMAWHGSVVRLRQEYTSAGWKRDDTANFATIIDHRRLIKVAVANTDEATGNVRILPTNRSKKGELGRQAAAINQHRLPFEQWSVEPESAKLPGFSTWYLCLYVRGETVRAELSLPTKIEKGYFVEWAERLILVSSDDDWRRALSPVVNDDDGPEFKVVVNRK